MATVLALLLVSVWWHPSGASQRSTGVQGAAENVIDSIVRMELNARPVAGMQVAVVQGEDTVYRRSHGSADLEHGVAMEPDAVFQIASITKQFTAAAVLRLVEEGALALDDDVRTYLPELETGDRRVLLRQMLNHTSGLPDIYALTSWPEIRPLRLLRPEARRLEIAGVAEDSLDFPPGSDFRYSNTGYDLLGDIVEEITGEDVESHFRRDLFRPLGLEHTGFCPWKRILPNRVRGYEPDSTGTALENARRQAQGVLHTSGGICSTVGDLLRWNEALHGGRLLSEASYDAMVTPGGASSSYGFGLFVRDLDGHRRLTHNGYTPGYSGQLEYYPDDGLSIVVLANSPARVQTLAEDIARHVLGLGPRPISVRPAGWRVSPFAPDADTTTVHFRPMGPGLHVTAGAGAIYFHPDSTARGDFTLEATFISVVDPGPAEGHGLLLGGRTSDAGDATYVAFLTRRGGEFSVIRRDRGRQEVLVPWTASAAVEGGGRNTLTVAVSGEAVELFVNAVHVDSLARADVGETRGLVGLWIGGEDDVHIDGFRTLPSN